MTNLMATMPYDPQYLNTYIYRHENLLLILKYIY
jgi:hypothetical protein